MMKKTVSSIALFAFVVTLATAAFAVQSRGIVTSLDINEPSIVIKQADGTLLKLIITPKTDVQQGMRTVPLEMFKPGTLVVVRYKIKDGKNKAKYIGYESGELQHFGTMKK